MDVGSGEFSFGDLLCERISNYLIVTPRTRGDMTVEMALLHTKEGVPATA